MERKNQINFGFGGFCLLKLPLDEKIYVEHKSFLSEKMLDVSENRKEEFIAGRACAYFAAEKIGETLDSLPVGANREPLWPKGLVGSISHSRDYAAALVDHSDSSLSIGIDIEKLGRNIEAIEKKVISSKEKAFLKLFKQKDLAFTVLFAAKEALYKLLYPLFNVYFGFEEAQLTALDLNSKKIVLKLCSEKSELNNAPKIYHGDFKEVGDNVIVVLRLKSL